MIGEGLDDVLDRLRDLSGLLHEMNNELLPSYKKLSDALEELDPHWKDGNRLEHDQITNDLFHSMERHLHHNLPDMSFFVEERIRKLEDYFQL